MAHPSTSNVSPGSRLLCIAALVFGVLPGLAEAYELRLIREIAPQGPGVTAPDVVTAAQGDPVYSLYLDTEGESFIASFAVGLVHDSSFLQYAPSRSDATDEQVLWGPWNGNAKCGPTSKCAIPSWLVADFDPPRDATSPVSHVMIGFTEVNSALVVSTATNVYLGTIAFDLVGDPGPAGTRLSFGFDDEGQLLPDARFVVSRGGLVDIRDEVSLVVAWVPEPSTALLLGLGLAGLARWRRLAG